MWARIINALAGLWVMIAPGWLDFHKTAANNNYITGPLVVTAAIVAMWEVNRGVRYFNVVAGGWLILSGLLFASGDMTIVIANAVAGICILLCAFVKGKITKDYGGGWGILFRKRSSPQ